MRKKAKKDSVIETPIDQLTFYYTSTQKSSIISKVDKARDFKQLVKFYFSAGMVKNECQADFAYMDWLFKGLKTAKSIKNLSFTFVYYFTVRQDSPLVMSLPFKNFLRLNKLDTLTISVNILQKKQRAHLWRIIRNLPLLKSLTIDLFNRPSGMLSPYLYDDTADKLSVPNIIFHYYYSTMDIYIFAKFIHNVELFNFQPMYSKDTKIEKKQLMYSLATFEKRVNNMNVVTNLIREFSISMQTWGVIGSELGFKSSY